VNLELSSNLSS